MVVLGVRSVCAAVRVGPLRPALLLAVTTPICAMSAAASSQDRVLRSEISSASDATLVMAPAGDSL